MSSCHQLSTSELNIVIGDNNNGGALHDLHKKGYNGIWSLKSKYHSENIFVPQYAGLNLEHILDGYSMTAESVEDFEPRTHPMSLIVISDDVVELHQETTPLTGVSSVTRFEVREPHFIDFKFTACLHRATRAGQHFGFFWASYMNQPQFSALFFLDEQECWRGLSPLRHGDHSENTLCHMHAKDIGFDVTGENLNQNSLTHSISQSRFSQPLLWGRPGDGSMLFLLMFDQKEKLRLTMSPQGGGLDEATKTYNPAWDFQFIEKNVEAGQSFSLNARLVYKPFDSREEILQFYKDWLNED